MTYPFRYDRQLGLLLPHQKPAYSGRLVLKENHWSTDGLVGYWLMNEGGSDIIDLSGNGNNGTLNNGVTWATGQLGAVLDFGTTGNEYVLCPAGMTSDPMTIVWRMKSASSIDQVVFMDRDGHAAGNGIEIYQQYNNRLNVRGSSGTSLISAGDWDGEWIHGAVVYNGASATLYRNGLYDNDGVVTTVAKSTHAFLMGIYGDESSYELQGLMDYVNIYNRVLSAVEIAKLYNNPFITVAEEDLAWLYQVAVGGVAPTGVFYGPLVGPLGGPI